MRVVLDTDVMVAAIRSAVGASRWLLLAGVEGRLLLLVSPALFLEYEAVPKRPEHLIAAKADETMIDVILDLLALEAEQVQIHYRWRPQLADVGDELVLETAVNGRADVLVTFNIRDFELGARRFG